MQKEITVHDIVNFIAGQVAARVAERLVEDNSVGGPRPRLLTADQAATYLGRTREAVQHLIAAGKLPTVRLDRRVFLDVEDLDRLIDRHKLAA